MSDNRTGPSGRSFRGGLRYVQDVLARTERQGLLYLKQLRASCRTAPDVADKQVVFVAGVQRSGTNMMTDILERSFETEVFRESDPRAFDHYELRPLSVLRGLVRASKAHTVVFKCLCELQDLRALLDAFPRTKAVWNLRRVDDMVNSHARAQFKAGRQRLCPERMNSLVVDPLSAGWRGRGMSEATRNLLRTHCAPDMSHESAVALFWLMRNRLYFEKNLQTDPRVRVVRYEEFVQAPAVHGTALFDWLGLTPSAHAWRTVSPRSVGRWEQPEITSPIRDLCRTLDARFRDEAWDLCPSRARHQAAAE